MKGRRGGHRGRRGVLRELPLMRPGRASAAGGHAATRGRPGVRTPRSVSTEERGRRCLVAGLPHGVFRPRRVLLVAPPHACPPPLPSAAPFPFSPCLPSFYQKPLMTVLTTSKELFFLAWCTLNLREPPLILQVLADRLSANPGVRCICITSL